MTHIMIICREEDTLNLTNDFCFEMKAGDNHHFHPTCARCSKCGDPFGDGEEMFLQVS